MQAFDFDRVFGPEVQQAGIFQDVSQLVTSALDGYNVCIFAYGQTGKIASRSTWMPPYAWHCCQSRRDHNASLCLTSVACQTDMHICGAASMFFCLSCPCMYTMSNFAITCHAILFLLNSFSPMK